VVAGLDLPLVWWEKGRCTPLEEGSTLGRVAGEGGTPSGSEGARPEANGERKGNFKMNVEREGRPGGASWLVWFGATRSEWGWSSHWTLVRWNQLAAVWARASTRFGQYRERLCLDASSFKNFIRFPIISNL
jgi:hypothetical protein